MKKEFHISQETLEDNVEALAPLSQKQEDFLSCTSDIVLWSGGQNSGKSLLCLMDLAMCSVDDKHFTATIVRDHLKKVKQAGGLFDTSQPIFKRLGASTNSMELTYTVPNGARIKFSHLSRNVDAFQGSNVTRLVIDEAPEPGIEEKDVLYLITRLRGRSKLKKQLKMTGNPNVDSFLREWLEKGGYLDEDGYHRESMDGVETYLLQVGGNVELFKTRKDIVKKYNEKIAKQALTMTSFNANIFSNPVAMSDPFNLHTLENLEDSEKQRLLYGSWYSREHKGGYINRDMLKSINASEVPLQLPTVRAWDVAASKVGEVDTTGRKELFPDYTVGIKCSYDPEDGSFYILDMKRFQDGSAIVVDTILKTAKRDSCYVSVPQDAGSAGKIFADYLKSRIMRESGSRVILDRTTKDKLTRAEAFIVAAQEGKVHVVNSVFDNDHLKELEDFTGERSTRKYKDDIVDSLASAYNALAMGTLIPSIRVSGNSIDTAKRLQGIGGHTLL